MRLSTLGSVTAPRPRLYLLEVDRYEAAIRLERARQIVRENIRYGYPVTQLHTVEVHDAEHDYVRATNAIAAAEASGVQRVRPARLP